MSGVILGAAAPQASALPSPFFGLHFNPGAQDDPIAMNSVAKSGAKYWHIPFNCFDWYKDQTGIWTKWDSEVKLAWERGMTILPVVGGRCASESYAMPLTTEFQNLASPWEIFLVRLVEHYGYGGQFWTGKENKKEIGAWEVWNEPNLGVNGLGGKEANGWYYGMLFKRSSEILHAAQGTFFPTKAIFGGMYSIKKSGYDTAGYYNEDPYDFLKEAAEQIGIAGWVDGVADHPYAFGANAVPEVEQEIQDTYNDVYRALGSFKPFWITELGWPVEPWGDAYHVATSLESQADALKHVFEWVKTNQAALNIQSLIYYNYRDFGWYGNNWDAHSGLRADYEGQQREYRPAWFEFQKQVGVPTWSPQTAAVNNAGTMNTWRTDFGPNGGATNRGVSMAAGTSPGIAGMTGGGYWGNGYVVVTHDSADMLHVWTLTNGDSVLGNLSVAANTSPGVAALKFGNYVAAINEKSSGNLYTWSTMSGVQNKAIAMAPGTSPSVAALPNQNYVIAVQEKGGNLYLWSSTEGVRNTGAAMAAGSSPTVVVRADGSLRVSFRGADGNLKTWSPEGGGVVWDRGVAVKAGTSPSMAALPNNSYVIAFNQASTGNLYTWTPAAGSLNSGLGMAAGTSPSVAALPAATTSDAGGYAIAMQANTGVLWTWTSSEGALNRQIPMSAGSSPAIESGATPFPAPPSE